MLAPQDVLRLLRIHRVTLHRWVESGLIRTTILPNKRYDYNDEDVYKLLNKDIKRKTVIYARVSTQKQINAVYQDIASGISFDKRKEFFQMLDEIIDHRIEKVIIAYKDRLSRIGFELFSHLFNKYGTEIVVIV